MAAMVAVASVWVAGADPAGAEQTRVGVDQGCPDALKGRPSGGLVKETQPPDGSGVRGGDVIKVTLRWDKALFERESLHKALDCVTIDGELAPGLSVEERDTANDGVFEHSFTVPDGLPDGTRLCDRGFISGPGREGRFEREKSNDVCFNVGGQALARDRHYEEDDGFAPPVPTPAPAPEVPPPPPVAAAPAGGPAPPAVAVPAPAPERQVAEGPPVPQPAAALPRTGSDGISLVLVSAAALLSGAFRIAARAGAERPPRRLARR
jgi:hypothetical protein